MVIFKSSFFLKPSHVRTLAVLLPWFALAGAQGAGPVIVREHARAVTIANDFLERTIDFTDAIVHTERLVNKISGRTYEVCGDEFEIKLNFEYLTYTFGSENPLRLTSRDFTAAPPRIDNAPDGGKRLFFPLKLKRPAQEETTLQAAMVYELQPKDFYTRQWLELRVIGTGTYFIDSLAVAKNQWASARFNLGGFGQPLFARDLFLGLEYPTSLNTVAGPTVALASIVGLDIPPEGFTSEPAVIGVASAGQVHQSFMEYVRRIRAAPVRPFVMYNTWRDLQWYKMRGLNTVAMNSENTLARVHEIDELLLKKYNLHLDAFMLDDGWDNMSNLWTIDFKRFPNGFLELTSALQSLDSNLGLWLGPAGGYYQHAHRVATARSQGMEVTSNGEYLCLAGHNYRQFLRQMLLKYQKEYHIKIFKLDGLIKGCNMPNHGHPIGIYSREADVRAFIEILETLRNEDPQIFLDITSGLWLSPWWLRWADAVWMGGKDYDYLDAVPYLTERQAAISYRDAGIFENYQRHQVQLPISSLTIHSILRANALELGGEQETLDDWKDALVNFATIGSRFFELYISPSLLSRPDWDALGQTVHWWRANAHPLLDNSTMVLGDPTRREVYGYLHYSPEKTLLTLRNPFIKPQRVELRLDDQAGFLRNPRAYLAQVIYPYRKILVNSLRYGDLLRLNLDGYEQIIVELSPVLEDEALVEGVPFSVEPASKGEVRFHLYAPAGSDVSVRIPHISVYENSRLGDDWRVVGAESAGGNYLVHFGKPSETPTQLIITTPKIQDEGNNTTQISFRVQVPDDFRDTQVGLLLESAQPTNETLAAVKDDGQNVQFAVRKSEMGLWNWFTTDLNPGRHALEFDLRIPAAARGRLKLSAWLRTKRQLAIRDLRLSFKPGRQLAAPRPDILPTASEVAKVTQLLFQDSL
jgi:hypothetical protein